MTRREFFKLSLASLTAWSLLPVLPVLGADRTGSAVIRPPIEGTPLHFTEALEPRKLTNLLIVHHVGGTNRDVTAADIHQWHLQNGWAGIGYHYVIHKDGTIEQGRPEHTVGAHCYGYNQTSVGIVSVGDFETYEPTKQQLSSVIHLLSYLCWRYHIQPSSSTIVGHRDLNETACPGRNYYAHLPWLRKQVAARVKNIEN
ncbi:N-acetylmuramoyl-L-alanine amidase [uncultured Megasphaera sp.]|uniref:N-acetylmuramoyl-L-alanine amidase n=1 Tax=uncultured Megasphaera sp. TaxID=165188 RepID=UPI00265A34DB|nr:N-acetylmuramoyl-L-alanine amidase [uncultured Megasphaera sp.]